MKQEIELIQYLPEFLQEITEYQQLFRAENPEFALLYEMADALLNNGFIKTADLQGLKRWEKLLGTSTAGQDMEERRAAVLGKWNRSLPYTITRLYEYLDILAERTAYHIGLFPSEYRLELITEDLPAGTLRAMRDLVQVMLPANLLFLLTDRIPGAAAVLLEVQARMRITGAFWPRSNLPRHLLDGATRLDGRYPLNGYLSGQSLDFYPLELQVAGAVVWRPTGAGGEAGDAAAEILLQFLSQARQPVDSGMDFGAWWGATLALRPAGQLHLSGAAEASPEAGAAAEVRGEAAEVISSGRAGMAVKGEADAGILPAVTAQILSSAGSAEAAKSEAGLIVEKAWGTLDGNGQLDGSRLLNAARYAVGL